jgi:hypothetical protein
VILCVVCFLFFCRRCAFSFFLLAVIIDRTADFVRRVGPQFEGEIMQRNKYVTTFEMRAQTHTAALLVMPFGSEAHLCFSLIVPLM